MNIMKSKINIFLIGFLSSVFTQTLGQSQSQSIGLSIGDTLPEFLIPKTIFSNQKTNTKIFKNQLLIIDFWGPGCKTCIESLPKMADLEKKFGSKLRILPVTYGKKKNIYDFWKSNKYTKNLRGSSVVEDTVFNKYFKHMYIPHEVWVNKGKIVGITSLEYVDEYNINKVLMGEPVDWPLKNDFYNYDLKKPLFTINENSLDDQSNITYYAAIRGFKHGVNSPLWLTGGSGIVRDPEKKTIRCYFLNQPILNSYLSYWFKLLNVTELMAPQPTALFPNQVSWQVKNRSKYVYEKLDNLYQQNWLIKNGICFESMYADTGQSNKQIYRRIISDLDRILGLKVAMRKSKENVFVLIDNLSANKMDLKSQAGVEYSLYDIFYNFNSQVDNPYMFNETKDGDRIIKLKIKSWKDIEGLKNGLLAAGIELKVESRIVDKLFFEENCEIDN